MALSIRNEETEELAEALAKLTGETKTEAVEKALRDRLERVRRERTRRRLASTRAGARFNAVAAAYGSSAPESFRACSRTRR